MKKKLWFYSLIRWSIPVTVTCLLIFLLQHKSPNPYIFARYSYEFFLLLLATGTWAGVCWWTILNQSRYHALLKYLLQLPVFSMVTIVIGMLILIDLFFDLTTFFSISPLIPALFMLMPVLSTHSRQAFRLSQFNRLREITHIAAISISALIIGLIISEILFRRLILEPQIPTDEQGFTKLIASSWPRNIPPQKEPGTFRILGLSDSYGRAGGAKNYHYLLETLLRDAGLKVELINLSVVDYGPDEQLEVLRQFGARYKPDLVLHGFYVGNDLEASKINVMKYLGIGVRSPPGLFAYRPRNFLLVQWLKFYIRVTRDRNLRETEAASNQPAGTFSREGFLQVERRHLEMSRLDPPPEQRWTETIKTLDEIRTEVDRIGATYVMIIHPDQYQVEEPLRQDLKQVYELDLRHYDVDLPQRFLLDYCSARTILCLDLLPYFRANGAEGGLYLLRDTHYNDRGNDLAAKLILDFFQENNLSE